jgi:hypothetical protein
MLEKALGTILNNQNQQDNKFDEFFKTATNIKYVELEDEEINLEINEVMFLNEVEDSQEMVLDIGHSRTIVGRNWLNNYLEKRK